MIKAYTTIMKTVENIPIPAQISDGTRPIDIQLLLTILMISSICNSFFLLGILIYAAK